MGWGGFLDKVMEKLPIQGRKERIKNQIEDLERQQKELIQGECTLKKTALYQHNKSELARLHQLISNFT